MADFPWVVGEHLKWVQCLCEASLVAFKLVARLDSYGERKVNPCWARELSG